MEKPKKSAMEKAMRLLSRRALSERELLNKLCAAGYPFREARDAVAECRKRGYVNDEAFAAITRSFWPGAVSAGAGSGLRCASAAYRPNFRKNRSKPPPKPRLNARRKRSPTNSVCSHARPIRAASAKKRSAF